MPTAALDRPNAPPAGFDPDRDLPRGFPAFFARLHAELGSRREALAARRRERLARAHAHGELPAHLPPSPATTGAWRIELPQWCADQRNQMTGPADDAELVVKMLNSGAPGVMLDLEDSMANAWPNLMLGVQNMLAALEGRLTYADAKRGVTVGIRPGPTAVWNRVRGLHLAQAGVLPDGALAGASLFDLALLAYQVEPERLRHPLAIYIPKSESAEEALWWRDAFQAIADLRGWPRTWIRCMALVESHPLAYEMEEFLGNLRDHIVGLNLGRWDYMASLIHWNLADPEWVLPDRNTIPHDVPFFQRVRHLLVDICHRRGALAIGGMTALYPSRTDAELNARALAVLEQDKRNEATCLMDGAWTGHPDQNAIAVEQFPAPNQLARRPEGIERYPDLRPVPRGVGRRSVDGTRAAARTVIRYRNGVVNGRGASLLDGYMEDLATDRIYRLMLAQRVRHRDAVAIPGGDGAPVLHDPAFLARCLDEALAALTADLPSGRDAGDAATLAEARRQSQDLIERGCFDPQ
ncbi:MAG TPA: malate synthase A [Candidatus Eisenbacteria bacterium]|nr:malate synthase A [Candidatus Eisenbacteria bacterium]